MAKKDKKLNTGNPQKQLEELKSVPSKYKLGEEGYSFYDIKHLKPVFAFDYLSLNGSERCFNSNKLEIDDYVNFFKGLKTISAITYDELKRTPNYRFHTIDFDAPNVAISKRDFKKTITFKEELLSDDELPTLYQFDLNFQEARAFGFLFKGVFYLVWFDRFHTVYPWNP